MGDCLYTRLSSRVTALLCSSLTYHDNILFDPAGPCTNHMRCLLES